MDEVALLYDKIVEKMMHYKNGVVSTEMQSLGLDYKANYGLSITQIDEIAIAIIKNNELALFCWKQDLRESKLLAFRLIIPELITKIELDEILTGITNPELAEQAAFNLFVHFADNLTFLTELFSSGSNFVIYAGLLTILRKININKEIDFELYSKFIELLKTTFWRDKPYIKRALSTLLVKIALTNKTFEQKVLDWIDTYKSTNQYFSEHLKTEVIYFLQTKN
jgi:3-methyladenine DNA glycosylase AlkD